MSMFHLFANCPEPDEIFHKKNKVFCMRSIVNDKQKIATEKEKEERMIHFGLPLCSILLFSYDSFLKEKRMRY